MIAMTWLAQRLLLCNAICRTFYGIYELSLLSVFLCVFPGPIKSDWSPPALITSLTTFKAEMSRSQKILRYLYNIFFARLFFIFALHLMCATTFRIIFSAWRQLKHRNLKDTYT